MVDRSIDPSHTEGIASYHEKIRTVFPSSLTTLPTSRGVLAACLMIHLCRNLQITRGTRLWCTDTLSMISHYSWSSLQALYWIQGNIRRRSSSPYCDRDPIASSTAVAEGGILDFPVHRNPAHCRSSILHQAS